MTTLKRLAKKIAVPHKDNDFRPYILRAGGLALLVFLAISLVFTASIYEGVLVKSDFIAAVLPAVLADLANTERSSNALELLAINDRLNEAARLKAEDMARKGYFSHQSPDGITPWYWFAEAGYRFAYAGENLAVRFDDSDAVNSAWMNSPSHRANILNSRFTEIGIATARGVYKGEGTIFVVEMFGTPAKLSLAPPLSETPSPSSEPDKNVSSNAGLANALQANVVPITPPSSVLGAESEESFIAVEDQNATPVSGESQQKPADFSYASFFYKLASSPTKVLAIFYSLFGVALLFVLFAVLFTRHEKRALHVFYIVLIVAFIALLYGVYKSKVFSRVNVLDSNAETRLNLEP